MKNRQRFSGLPPVGSIRNQGLTIDFDGVKRFLTTLTQPTPQPQEPCKSVNENLSTEANSEAAEPLEPITEPQSPKKIKRLDHLR